MVFGPPIDANSPQTREHVQSSGRVAIRATLPRLMAAAKGSGALEGALFIVAYASLVWLIGSAILYWLARR